MYAGKKRKEKQQISLWAQTGKNKGMLNGDVLVFNFETSLSCSAVYLKLGLYDKLFSHTKPINW